MHEWTVIFALIFCAGSTFAQGTIDVSQSNISGSAFSSQLGNPFGQTFRPTIAGQLGGVVVGIVNVNTPAPLSLSLFLTDASGALIGNPLASGSLSAQEVLAFATTPAATPVFVYIPFDTPYSQLPGQSLAFTIDQNPLSFYYSKRQLLSRGPNVG
jgi:hypothetical protein